MIAPLRPDDPPAIGPYRLAGQLGGGGMGQVFLGRSADGQPVAVKVIRAELASDPEFRTRFRHEVAAARKVSGKFTAQVVDADLDGPVQWLANTYVAGPSLAEAVSRDGPLPVDKALRLAAGLAEGLTAIHAAGVVHRDLKPANVLLTEDGPRVIDFGICWAAWASANPGSSFGSPRFMSPEHALGQAVGPPSDIFSLGAVLTFAATGRGPFGSGSNATLIYRLVNSPARLDCMPAELRELAGRCLAKDPGDRPSASDLLTQVHAIQQQSGFLPEPAAGASAADQPATGITDSESGADIPAPAGVSSQAWLSAVPPLAHRRGRDLRRRVSRTLPLFAPGLAAALAAAVYLMSHAAAPSPEMLTQPQAGVTAPAVQAQPQAGGAATMAPTPVVTVTARPSASARKRQIGAAIIHGPSAFLSPSAFTTTLPVPSGPQPVTPASPPSSSSSGSGSASAKPSKSGSPSPTASKSGSSSPTASKSGSSSPTGSASGTGSPSSPPSSSSPPPTSASVTPTPTAA